MLMHVPPLISRLFAAIIIKDRGALQKIHASGNPEAKASALEAADCLSGEFPTWKSSPNHGDSMGIHPYSKH